MRKNLRAILDSLFISKVRVKILRLFYSHVDIPYHIRGVVREIGEEINAVRRELIRLEEIGLLSSEKKGNRIYFSLCGDFILFNEISGIIHKTYGLGEEVIRNVDELGDVKFALLTKSYIKGIKTGADNIDLLVVGKIDLDALSTVVQRAERQTGREINYTTFKESDFNIRKKRRDPFIISMLLGSKVMLFGDEDDLVS